MSKLLTDLTDLTDDNYEVAKKTIDSRWKINYMQQVAIFRTSSDNYTYADLVMDTTVLDEFGIEDIFFPSNSTYGKLYNELQAFLDLRNQRYLN